MYNTSPSNNVKLEKMASKNATWLKHLKATIDPLAKLALTLQGEKGVYSCWLDKLTHCVYPFQNTTCLEYNQPT